MKRVFTIISILVAGSLAAQDTRNLETFDRLKTSSALEIELTQADINQVTITGVNPEDYEKIRTEIKDGELNIFTKGTIRSNEGIKIALQFVNLSSISCSGASEIKTMNPINGNTLTITGSGASDMDLDLNLQELTVDFSGASDIKLRGSTDQFNLTLSGASSMRAGEFQAREVIVDVSGAADVKVFASESISGKATGASSINVKGDPAIKNINNSGAASANFGHGDNINVTVGKKHIDIDDEEVNVGTGKHKVSVHEDTTTVSWGNTRLIIIDDSVYVEKKEKKKESLGWC